MNDYSEATEMEFDEILLRLLNRITAAQIIAVPGVYEILSEEFNNDVLDIWSGRRA